MLKVWYEQRIEEETAKNLKLRLLHESLTQIKLQQKQHEMNVATDT